MRQVDSIDLAEYLLTKAQQYGDVSHLKLQKLLFYVQAYHLAYFEQPLVSDRFQAWVHGPVSRKLYNFLKDSWKDGTMYGPITYRLELGELTPIEKLQAAGLTPDQIELIDDVLEGYGPLTAYQLENQTHEETPWREARRGYGPADRCERELDEKLIRNYYRKLLDATAQD